MSQIFRAGHIPGLPADQVGWRDLGTSDPALQGVHVPVLTEAQIRSITATVREQSALHLRSRRALARHFSSAKSGSTPAFRNTRSVRSPSEIPI